MEPTLLWIVVAYSLVGCNSLIDARHALSVNTNVINELHTVLLRYSDYSLAFNRDEAVFIGRDGIWKPKP